MASNHILLERIELSSTVSSITFTNIPQTGYTDLKIVINARCDYAAVVLGLVHRFNGDTTAGNYTGARIYGSGGGQSYDTDGGCGFLPGTSATSNAWGNTQIIIPSYNVSGITKTISIESQQESNATGNNAYMTLQGSKWSGTSAITTMQIYSSGGNFIAGSTFSLYGVAAVGTTPSVAPYAIGGQTYSDGTYWYHVFASSGIFTPLKALTANSLVVGGGGGGGTLGGGGGGAGALITYTSTPFLSGIPYQMIVGAGGLGGIGKAMDGASGPGNNGNKTVCYYNGGSLTAAGGGGGAGYQTIGADGASGGGGGTNNAGGGSATQGNAGGNGSNSGSYISGGGGGGYSSAGGNASTNGGNGGNGWTIDSGTLNATPGMTILAAGGGGDCFAGYTPGTANAGAGKGFANGTATSATSYGSGGGGVTEPTIGGNWTAGGNGMSGAVIIRYAI
jgi:hypothetical protein